MPKRAAPDRATRHNQTPVMRAQIKAFRAQAIEANTRSCAAPATSGTQIAEMLASNMAASFALELSLKVLYMTFREDAPDWKHQLDELWQDLPPEWRSEIDREYRNDPRVKMPVQLAALQIAPNPPAVPRAYTIKVMSTADELFVATSKMFTQSRYFYEQVKAETWAHVDHPIHQMLVMLDVLTAFYDHLLAQPPTDQS